MGKRSGWRRAEGKFVLVNLQAGRALQGRLADWRGDVLTITSARLFEVDGPTLGVPLDGPAHVDVANVTFVEELQRAPILPGPAPERESDEA